MSIQTEDIEVKWVREKLICDLCGYEMISEESSVVLMSYPPQYVHKCTNEVCGYTINMMDKYPVVKMVLVDG